MKCEGPEKAPCRRCRAAQVECVFEAPPAAPPRPRGTGVTEAWVEGCVSLSLSPSLLELVPSFRPDVDSSLPCRRLGQVEHRLELLEDTAAHSTSLVSGNGSAPPVSPQTVTDHERRLAALEAQLYNLQITMARQVQIPPQQHQPPHSMYGSGPSSHAALEYPQQQQQHVYGSSNGAGGSHPYPSSYSHPSLASSAPPSHARFDSPTMPKHELDRSHSSASARLGSGGSGSGAGGAAASSDAHREKRWKGESAGAGEGDFIARGLVSEEEAALCFDS